MPCSSLCLGVLGALGVGRLVVVGKTALSVSILPLVGIACSILFCWGHPLTWLGPSLMYVGTPLALGCSITALRKAADLTPVVIAIVLSVLESLLLACSLLSWIVYLVKNDQLAL